MEAAHIPDVILHKILIHLSTKSLVRLRSVSRGWNHLIMDPYLMKTRSRRLILFPVPHSPLHVIDDNVPVEDKAFSTFKIPFRETIGKDVTMPGSFNGIVLMAVKDIPVLDYQTVKCAYMILYNPFTGASKKVNDSHHPCNENHVYGFGHGANPNDLKIIRIRDRGDDDFSWNTCDIFSFKTNSWSMNEIRIMDAVFFGSKVGMFANGFLHWIVNREKILAFDIDNVVSSEIPLPRYIFDDGSHMCYCLGALNGNLCMMTKINPNGFNVWVMKEHGVENSWVKVCSFTLCIDGLFSSGYGPINIMDDGRILMENVTDQLIIYDTTKQSYKLLNSFASYRYRRQMCGVEYVESLVSP